jgi:hypothetical protein
MSTPVVINFRAETEAAASKINSFLDGLRGRVGAAVAGLGATLSAAALVRWTKNAIDSADAMGKLAQKTGTTTEFISTLGYAAEKSDVQLESLKFHLKTLSTNVVNAAQGNAQLQSTFDQLGVSIFDTEGKIRKVDEVFYEVTEGFSGLKDGVAKTDMAVQLFGRSGEDLIPLLNEGAAGVRNLQKEAKNLGLEISGSTAASANQFNDELTKVKGLLDGIFLKIAEQILPILISFSNELGTVAKQTANVSRATVGILEVFKALAWILGGLKVLLFSLGAIIGHFFAAKFTIWAEVVRSVSNLLSGVWDWVQRLIAAFKNLGATWDKVGEAFQALRSGNFSQGFKLLRDAAEEANGAFAGLGESPISVKRVWGEMLDLFERTAPQLKGIWADLRNTITAEMSWFEKMQNVLSGKQRPEPVALTPSGDNRRDPQLPTSSNAKKLLEELDRDFNRATLKSRELLKIDFQERLALIDKEIKVEKDRWAAKFKAAVAYFAAVKKLNEEEQRELLTTTRNAADILSESLRLKRDTALNDPDLTRNERNKIALQTIRQENELIRQRVEMNQQILRNESAPQENKETAAQDNLVMLARQVELQRLKTDLDPGFFTTMRRNLIALSDEWTNLGVNVANVLTRGIQSAIDATADSIMGLIDGTMTWGQAFSRVARQIIADILRVILQWIAGKLIMMALEKVFSKTIGATAATTAAQLNAYWAPAAVNASIASYGAAAAAGLTLYTASLTSGVAMGVGMSAGSAALAFEKGGLVPGGRQMIQVNEAGQEFVVSNRGVQNVGVDFLNALNAGMITARDVATGIPEGIASQIPSSSFYSGPRSVRPTSASAAGAGSKSDDLTIIMVDSRRSAEFKQAMQSAEGRVIVLDIVKGAKIELGMKT